MGCIVVGPKHDVEGLAGAFVDVSQESCSLRLPIIVPVSFNADPRAIGKDESGDIYGVGARVFAEPPPIVDITAGVGADMLDSW